MKRIKHCKFYHGSIGRGMNKDHIVCDKGVFDKNWSLSQYPCIYPHNPCAHREYLSQKEIEQEEKEFDEHMAKVTEAIKLIKETGKQSGVIDCPKCGLAKGLRFTHSNINGHLHAGCMTKKCILVLE